MKNKLISILIIITTLYGTYYTANTVDKQPVYNSIEYKEPDYSYMQKEPVKMKLKQYNKEGLTTTGRNRKHGIAMSNKEMLGKTAIVYSVEDNGKLGEYLGIFEIEDCDNTLDNTLYIFDNRFIEQSNGTLEPYYNELYGNEIYVQIIEAVG